MPLIDEIINRQFRRWELEKAERKEPPPPVPPQPIVTVSRECGSRGAYFAELLAGKLGYQFIHREIVDAICESSGYRKRMIASLDEKYRSRLDLSVESFVSGQAVDYTDYVRYLCQVVLSMARLGGVVLVGRGGSFILGPKQGFHIRFICPLEKRIANLVTYTKLTPDEAASHVDRLDKERREMIEKLFDADINDPRNYDLVINTAYIDIEDMIPGVEEAIKSKLNILAQPEEQE